MKNLRDWRERARQQGERTRANNRVGAEAGNETENGAAGTEKHTGIVAWWRARTTHERVMIALVVVLLIGVVVRWSWIRREAADAFRQRIEHFVPPETQTGEIEQAETPENVK